MDATRLRKEIKAWERSFRADNARDVTVDDIKAHPQMAEKYKLYKKATKESAASTSSHKVIPAEPPRTPTRRNVSLAESPALISKPRASRSSMPTFSNNPFSPVKTPRKKVISPNDAPYGMPNFASPSFSTEVISASHFPNASRTGRAVSKARKRLRGDSVSPSPKKQPRILAPSESKVSDDDQTFIADSPVKASTGGKDFVSLFNEDRLLAPRFKALPDTEPGGSSQPPIIFSSLVSRNGRSTKAVKRASESLQKATSKGLLGENPKEGLSRKETAHLASEDSEIQSRDRKRPSSHGSDPCTLNSDDEPTSLLPPSPTQNASTKATAKSITKKRKKLGKIETASADDSSPEDEDIDVVEINPNQKGRGKTRQNPDEDEDWLFANSFELADEQPVYASQPEAAHELEASLPGELREVLHISHSQASEMKERALAESLLKGELRHPWQDDVWGAGEFDRVGLAASDDEEDWEGEGTPWEVGEM